MSLGLLTIYSSWEMKGQFFFFRVVDKLIRKRLYIQEYLGSIGWFLMVGKKVGEMRRGYGQEKSWSMIRIYCMNFFKD